MVVDITESMNYFAHSQPNSLLPRGPLALEFASTFLG